VRDAWAVFCADLAGVRHDVIATWTIDDATIVEATVNYTRQDASRVAVPVVTIYRERAAEISDYRIFIDLAPLFAGHPPSAQG
jgi:hypothetical protein